jgi:hypothetical protein
MFTINYRYLTEAQEYYKQKGYRVVDLKWVVPRRIGSITSPEPNSQASYIIRQVTHCKLLRRAFVHWIMTIIATLTS